MLPYSGLLAVELWLLATRIGFEPTIFGLTGQYVNRYTTGPCVAPILTVDRQAECMILVIPCQACVLVHYM